MALDGLDLFMRWLAYPVGGAIFANQIDELFMDANYWFRGLHRHAQRVISAEVLSEVEQKRIAILLPAWKEAEVIERMIEHNLESIDYDPTRYDFFCGTYQNDPETQGCVDRLARRFHSVHKVVVPHDGPTSKADCLNWVYQGIVLEERRRAARFDILLMHDAEDIIHPLSLRLYSLLIPKYEFVQTPVFSLELKASQFIAGTYIDEFSEHHLKEMKVRQAMCGLVPSAGVGSAFERNAFEQIALSSRQQPFNPSSLTEDYEIGLKFRLAEKRVCFACHTVEHEAVVERGFFQKRQVRVKREEYIATREYFPSGLNASIRQRSRWILGITLQGWEQVGWQGALPVLYCLWRDRKGLLNSALLLLAYLFLVYTIARSAIAMVVDTGWNAHVLVPSGSLLSGLLALNLGAMIWRSFVKLQFVHRLYGLEHGLLALPRLVIANLICVLATARAVRMYVRHRITGQPLRWLKTTHAFPNAEALSERRRRLGELLVERMAVDASDIDAALNLQKRLDLPLGELLTITGVLSERSMLHPLAEHLEMQVRHPDPLEIPTALLDNLPESDAEEMNLLPFSRDRENRVLVAVVQSLPLNHRVRLEEILHSRVEPVLTLRRTLRRARSIAYRRLLDLLPASPRLGERLVERGRLDRKALSELLEEQLETGEVLGEMLLRKELVDIETLDSAFLYEGGFRRVSERDGDPTAIARLGYEHCALYSLIPLLRPDGTRRVIATAFPMHAQEKASLGRRLGEPIEVVLASRLQIRIALAIGRYNPSKGFVSKWDEGEIFALTKRGFCTDPQKLLSAARAAGTSPLLYLEKRGEVDPQISAEVRADTLGVPIAPPPLASANRAGVLPPGIARRCAIEVRAAEAGALVLAAPRPSPSLTCEIADLLPGWRIAWQVAGPRILSEEMQDGRAA